MTISSDLSALLAKVEAQSVSIGGKSVPVSAFVGLFKAVPQALADVGKGEGPLTILRDVAPTTLPAVEALANVFFPGAGDGIAMMAALMSHARPMTQEETNAWMDRQGSGEGGN